MGYVLIQTTHIPHKGLVFFFTQVTLQEELFKLPSILLHTFGSLFEVVEFEVVVMEVMGREEFRLEFIPHLSPSTDFTLPLSCPLGHQISPPN